MKKIHVGDNGETALIGKKSSKTDLRVEAYGTVDELNSFVGLSISFLKDARLEKILEKIQNDLFELGSELADASKNPKQKISAENVKWVEETMTELEKELKPIKKFVLPTGSRSASFLHVARTICRRCERRIVTVNEKEKINSEVLRYINRLSDLLFVLARVANQRLNVEEKTWGPEGILGI